MPVIDLRLVVGTQIHVNRQGFVLQQTRIQNLDRDINAMAKQFALPASEVSAILWGEIRHLERAARIRDFLPLLAIKHVKEVLRSRASASRISLPPRIH
jgi:hypothetical protein